MVFCSPVCQPHDLVSHKYLHSSTGHSVCLSQPRNLIFFACCSICCLLNHYPEIRSTKNFDNSPQNLNTRMYLFQLSLIPQSLQLLSLSPYTFRPLFAYLDYSSATILHDHITCEIWRDGQWLITHELMRVRFYPGNIKTVMLEKDAGRRHYHML